MHVWINGMSRVGKKPVDLPKGVEVTAAASAVKVKGPKGELHACH